MYKFKMALVASISLGLAACAQNPQVTKSPSEETKTVAQADSNQGKLRCRRMANVGSHFRRTICKTQEEWEQERRQAVDALEDAKQDSMANSIKAEGLTDGRR